MNRLNFHVVEPTREERAARFERLYLPQPEPRADGLRLWAIDLAAGVLWIATIAFLIAFIAIAVTP